MHADPRRQRQEALAGALSAAALDGLLVTSRANIRYLTGFSGSAAIVAVTQGDVLLVTDFRYDEQARAEAGAVARVEVESTSVWDRFFKELATLGPLAALGYEAHALTVQDAERFTQAGQAWRWTATKDLVERLRAAKGPGEVAAIRSAAELAGAALRDTLPQVRVGMTELEVAGVLEGALRRLGSEGHPFSTIVASGPRTALPHGREGRVAAARLRRASGRLLRRRHAHARRGRAGHGAAASIVRAGGGGAAAGARVCPRRDDGARRGCARAGPDRSTRLRGGVRSLARARAGTRSARGAAAVEDERRPPSRRRGGDDRAGRVSRRAGRCADRRRRASVSHGTGPLVGRPHGTSRTRVDFGVYEPRHRRAAGSDLEGGPGARGDRGAPGSVRAVVVD